MEVKKIKVEVICDTLVFGDRYYEKGKIINDFPYVESDHANHAKPIIETVEEPAKKAITEKVDEPVKAEIEEPVKKKGKR